MTMKNFIFVFSHTKKKKPVKKLERFFFIPTERNENSIYVTD